MPDPVRHGLAQTGPTGCAQTALITVDDETFEQIWTPSTLELLARSYWRFIRQRSLGLIRMSYSPGSRSVNLVSRRVPLLRFREPEFESGPDFGWVKWPIDRGILVAGEGRFDTVVMRSGHGQVLSKGGAEGIQCLSRVGDGLGLAIKVEDGASRAKHAVALHLMQQLEWLTPMTLEELGRQFLHPNEGVKLEVSGELRFDNGR